jgi:hypothetical protein
MPVETRLTRDISSRPAFPMARSIPAAHNADSALQTKLDPI